MSKHFGVNDGAMFEREEIDKMLTISDFRQTRVYQEALEEGMEKGVEKVALWMIKKNWPIAEIVEATGLSAVQVRKLKKNRPPV